jgi:5-formyltetrahydrofolate cyclo-ligase
VNSDELKRAKRRVRRDVLAARDALTPEERARRSGAVAERFASLPEVRAARTVLAFWSFGSELSTSMLMEVVRSLGAEVALPRITAGELEARVWEPGDALTETSFGALEPDGGRPLAPEAIDVIVTPAVAFDRSGRRVGYGGGYYDRLFPRTRADAARIGVGFAVQLVDDELPGGTFDLRVDAVVTELEVVRCRREG